MTSAVRLSMETTRPFACQRLDHWTHPVDLDRRAYRLGARPGRFAADVDNRRSGRRHRPAPRDRRLGGQRLAAVGEAVGRDVDHAHQPRPVERDARKRRTRRAERAILGIQIGCQIGRQVPAVAGKLRERQAFRPPPAGMAGQDLAGGKTRAGHRQAVRPRPPAFRPQRAQARRRKPKAPRGRGALGGDRQGSPCGRLRTGLRLGLQPRPVAGPASVGAQARFGNRRRARLAIVGLVVLAVDGLTAQHPP